MRRWCGEGAEAKEEGEEDDPDQSSFVAIVDSGESAGGDGIGSESDEDQGRHVGAKAWTGSEQGRDEEEGAAGQAENDDRSLKREQFGGEWGQSPGYLATGVEAGEFGVGEPVGDAGTDGVGEEVGD